MTRPIPMTGSPFIAIVALIAGVIVDHCDCLAGPEGLSVEELSKASIVVNEGAAPAERYAAEEFQGHFSQATGATLPIMTTAESATPHVYVGDGPLLTTKGKRGAEDFQIVVDERGIAISGGAPRGTLYGVYTFLEDALGVRFLTPDHTHVPRLEKTRSIAFVNRFYHPPLAFRHPGYDQTNSDRVFAARVRCNTYSNDLQYGGRSEIELVNHSLVAMIPVNVYAAEHAEYFALIDGKRKTEYDTSFPGETMSQPCLTNPEVLRIVTQAALDELALDPRRRMIAVAQNDNWDYCRCANCAAVDEREGSPMGSLLTFVNAVADAVAEKYPGVEVGTLAYQYSRKPPKTIKPRPNVRIQLCSIEACTVHSIDDPNCPVNRPFCEDLAGWNSICKKISIWAYNTNFAHYLLPCSNFKALGPSIRFFAANHVDGVMMQCEHGGNSPWPAGEFSDLRYYMTANLLWNPARNDQELMEEFLTLHYGAAAGPIREVIDLFYGRCEAANRHPDCFGSARKYGIDESAGQAALEAFARAMQLADDPVVRLRVEKASICAYRAAIEPAWSSKDLSEIPAPDAERLKPLVREFFRLCEKHGVRFVAMNDSLETTRHRFKSWLE